MSIFPGLIWQTMFPTVRQLGIKSACLAFLSKALFISWLTKSLHRHTKLRGPVLQSCLCLSYGNAQNLNCRSDSPKAGLNQSAFNNPRTMNVATDLSWVLPKKYHG